MTYRAKACVVALGVCSIAAFVIYDLLPVRKTVRERYIFKGFGPLENGLIEIANSGNLIVSDGHKCGWLSNLSSLDRPDIYDTRSRPLAVFSGYFEVVKNNSRRIMVFTAEDRRLLQKRSGIHLEVVQTFPLMHEGSIQGAVFDWHRKRLLTIGTNGKPSTSPLEEPDGPGSIKVWDADGSSELSAYPFLSEPRVIVSDEYSDRIAVGNRNGSIHLFRSTREGIEVMSHFRLASDEPLILTSLAISRSGEFIGAAGSSGSRLWRSDSMKSKFQDSVEGGVWTFVEGSSESSGDRAVLIKKNHVVVFSLDEEVQVQSEFEIEMSQVQYAVTRGDTSQVILLGRKTDEGKLYEESKDGSSMYEKPLKVYLLNLDNKSISELQWAASEK
jgi:hypothetical protein